MMGGRRTAKTIPTLKYVDCPACNKKRLLKQVQEDGTVSAVSTETVEVREEQRHVDVCEFCVIRYQKADQRFVMENLRKIQKAVHVDRDNVDSDHKDFQLDL
jgi:DNA-directed RNA polymerase subunit RPC12/RpoP